MNCPARVISASFVARAGISTGGPLSSSCAHSEPSSSGVTARRTSPTVTVCVAHRGHRAQAHAPGGEQVELRGVGQPDGRDERPGERRAARVVDQQGDGAGERHPQQGVEHHDQRVAVHPVQADQRTADDELPGADHAEHRRSRRRSTRVRRRRGPATAPRRRPAPPARPPATRPSAARPAAGRAAGSAPAAAGRSPARWAGTCRIPRPARVTRRRRNRRTRRRRWCGR